MKIVKKAFAIPLVKFIWYNARHIFSSRKSRIIASERLRYTVWGTVMKPDHGNPTPRIMWSYWNGIPSPSADACRKTWSEHQSNFTIHVLSKDTIKDFLPNFPDLSHNLPEQKVSNLIRLMLLERYGGIWVDYSTILSQSLDWVIELMDSNDCEMLAFYNEFHEQYRSNPARPTIENGFLASQPNSKFVRDWRDAYQKCIQSQDYKTFFRMFDNFDELSSNFLDQRSDYIDYFVCYFAAQQVMLNSKSYRLLLVNAEDEFYSYFFKTTPPRNRWKFAKELLLRTPPTPPSSKLIKINGWHRTAVDEHIQYGCYRTNSILGRYL